MRQALRACIRVNTSEIKVARRSWSRSVQRTVAASALFFPTLRQCTPTPRCITPLTPLRGAIQRRVGAALQEQRARAKIKSNVASRERVDRCRRLPGGSPICTHPAPVQPPHGVSRHVEVGTLFSSDRGVQNDSPLEAWSARPVRQARVWLQFG